MGQDILSRVLWCCVAAAVMLTSCEHEPPTGGGVGNKHDFVVQIEKTQNTLQGMHTIIDITLNQGLYRPTGFDFKISYDPMMLHFQAAIPGDFHNMCGWEYFSYRYVLPDAGSHDSPAIIEVVACADTHGSEHYQDSGCEIERMHGGPLVLFSVDFVVDDDRTLECVYIPIRFYWESCDDNTVTYSPNWDGGSVVTAVAKDIIDFDLIGSIRNDSVGFPTFQGFQRECYDAVSRFESQPVRLVDFLNGGVDIICADSVVEPGDVNFNGIPFEQDDLLTFSNYFRRGLGAFRVDQVGQIAATDVNLDGVRLSSSDYLYMIRNVIDLLDVMPVDSLRQDSAVCTVGDGILSVSKEVYAALVTIEGEATWSVLTTNASVTDRYDGTHTHLLIISPMFGGPWPWPHYHLDGPFLQTDGEVVAVDMSTDDGARVDVTIVTEGAPESEASTPLD